MQLLYIKYRTGHSAGGKMIKTHSLLTNSHNLMWNSFIKKKKSKAMQNLRIKKKIIAISVKCSWLLVAVLTKGAGFALLSDKCAQGAKCCCGAIGRDLVLRSGSENRACSVDEAPEVWPSIPFQVNFTVQQKCFWIISSYELISITSYIVSP